MNYLFILILVFQSITSAHEGDPFADPEPPKIVDFTTFKTKRPNDTARLYYFDIPSLHTTPTPLAAMPKATPNTEWKNATKNDLIYDISKWFSAVKTTNKKNLWVYFNKSKGYIITSADKWLYISVREFVIHMLENRSYQIHLNFDYITVDSKTKPTLASFKQSLKNKSATRHLHISTICKHRDQIRHRLKQSSHIDITTYCSAHNVYLEISLQDPQLHFQSRFSLENGQTLITPFGINSPLKKSYLVVSVDLVNLKNQPITIPKRSPVVMIEKQDPFGDGPYSIQCYPAPLDLHRAFGKTKYTIVKNHDLFNPDAFPLPHDR